MRSKKGYLIILCGFFLLSGCSHIFNHILLKDYFKDINTLTRDLGLTALRKTKVGPDSVEIRIWSGWDATYLSGTILRKDGNNWKGQCIQSYPKPGIFKLPTPTSGWNTLWDDLQELGILTLPGESMWGSELDEEESFMLDETCYVLEYKIKGNYRAYTYSESDIKRWPEAKSFFNILDRIGKEFSKTQN